MLTIESLYQKTSSHDELLWLLHFDAEYLKKSILQDTKRILRTEQYKTKYAHEPLEHIIIIIHCKFVFIGQLVYCITTISMLWDLGVYTVVLGGDYQEIE